MSIARKDDRHNEDLGKEIAESFNRAIGPKKREDVTSNDNERVDTEEKEQPQPRFVVTGDKRAATKKKRGRE